MAAIYESFLSIPCKHMLDDKYVISSRAHGLQSGTRASSMSPHFFANVLEPFFLSVLCNFCSFQFTVEIREAKADPPNPYPPQSLYVALPTETLDNLSILMFM